MAQEINVLEIIERAKHPQSGEGISFLESESNVREEAIRRGVKAGTCNSEGGPVDSDKIRSMPSTNKYNENYVKIFGHN